MPNVSQRDSTAIAPGGKASARHTNHLRSSACGLSSFPDGCIRNHQVLGRLPSPILVIGRKRNDQNHQGPKALVRQCARHFGHLSVGALNVGALFPRCILVYEDLSPLHLRYPLQNRIELHDSNLVQHRPGKPQHIAIHATTIRAS
jgi:hypothetical protein